MPLGSPRRIFTRQPRRPVLRLAVLATGACGLITLAAYPVLAALGDMLKLPASPHSVSADNAVVLDGQTLRVNDRLVRLAGVHTPDGVPGCAGAGCARGATLHLAALVRDRPVACQFASANDASRAVAHCRAGSTDLSLAIVASGWAEARGGTPALVQAETHARAHHLGLWAQR